MASPSPRPFPSKDEVVAFIRESGKPITKREIARAFQITGDDRRDLKALIRELEAEGWLERGRNKTLAPPRALPEVAVLQVDSVDADGEVIARPAKWTHAEAPPVIYVSPDGHGHPALAPGDRMLARLERLPDNTYAASTIRRLESRRRSRIFGIFEARGAGGGGRLRPLERRKTGDPILVTPDSARGVVDGDLVSAELESGPRSGTRTARIVERHGNSQDPRAISLIAIHSAEIPTEFPQAALDQAEAAQEPTLGGRRVDLRDLPLVTIDGADAKDFDDAVFAEPDPDQAANPEGWHLIVAIADVSHYVETDSPLDREAYRRGNSCYFPDRVVPMLPEALSNGLCSLRPKETRACVAAHLWIDHSGRLLRHRFERGLMRSAARLTYDQVQAARNGAPDDTTGPLLEPVITPLYGAYHALSRSRETRGTLDLDVPEQTIDLDDQGRIRSIGVRQRLDSHRLIEEFMICANVAAAQLLDDRSIGTLYRVHDAPDLAKVQALNEFLKPLGYRIAPGQVLRPRSFQHILEQAKGQPEEQTVHELILRTQSQALYSPNNHGHFGLSLPRYAHFTSPIRRYADLIVHRGLIRAMRLGPGGLDESQAARLDEIGEHISMTERRAAAAERDANDRYMNLYLADKVGGTFTGRITGVTRFGLFVRLSESGADGLVPISTLPDDYYIHDEHAHCLVGERWGRVYRLGATVTVKLVEADPLSGSTVLALTRQDETDGPRGADLPGMAKPQRADAPKRGRSRKVPGTTKPRGGRGAKATGRDGTKSKKGHRSGARQ